MPAFLSIPRCCDEVDCDMPRAFVTSVTQHSSSMSISAILNLMGCPRAFKIWLFFSKSTDYPIPHSDVLSHFSNIIILRCYEQIQDFSMDGLLVLNIQRQMVSTLTGLMQTNLATVVPEVNQEIIHRIIVEELSAGKFLDGFRQQQLSTIEKMKKGGAGGIVLGCTEISLLINQDDCDISIFYTAIIHANAALEVALSHKVQGLNRFMSSPRGKNNSMKIQVNA